MNQTIGVVQNDAVSREMGTEERVIRALQLLKVVRGYVRSADGFGCPRCCVDND
jgi:hypothetical protein